MAKRQFQLTDEARQALEQAEWQTRDACELRRLQAVRLYGSGVATPQIRRLVGCSDRGFGNGRRSINRRVWKA